MSDRRGHNDQQKPQEGKDLQVCGQAMDGTMPVDVEALTSVMTMMVTLVSVNLALDWKVDLLLALLREHLKEQTSYEESGNDADQSTEAHAQAFVLDSRDAVIG